MLRIILIFVLAIIFINIAFKLIGFAVALAIKATVVAVLVGSGVAAFYFVKNKMSSNDSNRYLK